jgi:hypothetical protein
MSVLLVTLALWSVVLWLGARLVRERPGAVPDVARRVWAQALFVAPRLFVGLMGAGFYAELVPEETMARVVGPESGMGGAMIAAAAGAVTPGGPIVGFAIAGALIGHAGPAQILTYVCGWSLFSVNRSLIWETPLMGAPWLRARLAVTAPVFLLMVGVLLAVA